jgi:hypothetical protein
MLFSLRTVNVFSVALLGFLMGFVIRYLGIQLNHHNALHVYYVPEAPLLTSALATAFLFFLGSIYYNCFVLCERMKERVIDGLER